MSNQPLKSMDMGGSHTRETETALTYGDCTSYFPKHKPLSIRTWYHTAISSSAGVMCGAPAILMCSCRQPVERADCLIKQLDCKQWYAYTEADLHTGGSSARAGELGFE